MFINLKGRALSTWVKSTRLFQGAVRQIGLVRENITVRLENISVRAALNRQCWRSDDMENAVTENAVTPESAIEMEIISK